MLNEDALMQTTVHSPKNFVSVPGVVKMETTMHDLSGKIIKCMMFPVGEIVHLTSWMRLVFEVSDLNHASPATVSR